MLRGMIFVPYFIGRRGRQAARLGGGEVVEPELPSAGTDQERLGVLNEALAGRVRAASAPTGVQVGDCTSTLGVAAGLERRGVAATLVWLDAHGDFNTWETTPSGFLGGMPLAMIAGLGEQTVVEAIGLTPLRAGRILLVGARDLDPGERVNLERTGVRQVAMDELEPPEGPLYVHLDIDLIDPDEMPAVNYPAPGGPTAAEVRGALERLFATGRVEAFSLTGWDPEKPGAERSRATAAAVVAGFL